MNLKGLTNENLVVLDVQYENREEALKALISKLYDEGKISSQKEFFNDVMAREKLSPTGLGEGLAIPHGKSDAVNSASIAVARLSSPIKDWDSIDEDDTDVNLIVLLAIPKSEAGSTHIDILTKLSIRVSDDEVLEQLMKVNSAAEFLTILEGEEEEKGGVEVVDNNKVTVVAVTACPAGVAHTYMAADALEKAGKKLGVNVIVEKQGANGIDGRLSDEALNNAGAVIWACEVAVKEADRFDGLPIIEVPVAEPLRKAEELVNRAVEMAKAGGGARRTSGSNGPKKELSGKELAKRALLTGISHIVPLIVAGGTILAIAVLIKEIFGLRELYGQAGSWLWMYRKLGGGMLGGLMVPVLSAYMAFSLAEKPGLGPGFAAGVAANLIGSGFLGGIAGGFIAGYFMRWVKKNIKGSKSLNGFFTFYLYPVLGSFVAGSAMLFIVGPPAKALNDGLTTFLNGLQGGNAMILGAILGCMVSFDLGGPVNKAAYAFCIGAMGNGNFMPYAAFASIKMVSAFTATLSTMLKPNYYLEEEIEAGKSTWILGLAGITEGAIPMMIEDPFRVIPAFCIGSAVTGAIVAATNIGLQVPGAGIVSMLVLEAHPTMSKMTSAGIWVGAALIGTVISTVALTSLKAHKYHKAKAIA